MQTDDIEKLLIGVAVVLLMIGTLFGVVAVTSKQGDSVAIGLGVAAVCAGALSFLTWRDVRSMSGIPNGTP